MRALPPVVIALLLAACTGSWGGSAGPEVTDTIPAPSTTTSTAPSSSDVASTTTTLAVVIPPQLADHDIDVVQVGERLMTLAIADSPALRGQGLMEVEDLGSLDGMLFYWREEAFGSFWMRNTVIPLDIVWFFEDGSFAGRASMVPCVEEECETYSPGAGIDYRFAIEARPGDLDWVDESTVILYSG